MTSGSRGSAVAVGRTANNPEKGWGGSAANPGGSIANAAPKKRETPARGEPRAFPSFNAGRVAGLFTQRSDAAGSPTVATW